MAGVALTVLSAHGGPLALTFGAADFDCRIWDAGGAASSPMVECAATCCAETWRRCAVLSQALAVAAGVQYLATILTPNELEPSWLLCYEA